MNEELFNELQKLLACFPGSYINRNLEVILIPKTNTYFSLKGVSSRRDIIAKLFMWCSRDFAKTNPFKYQKLNRLFHLKNSEFLGNYLGKRFGPSPIYHIYQKLGNGINPELTYRFIDSGFDMEVLDDRT